MLVQLDSSHRELIYRIRKHAEQYVTDKDTDQYQTGIDPAVVRKNLDRQIDNGQFYGWQTDDGTIVAVAALTKPDPDYWTPEEQAEPQTYIGRLYVAEEAHGMSYGAIMLDAIALEARSRGDEWIRLNCWTTNARLHTYYEDQGFDHVRTIDVPGRMSGALFQRPADYSEATHLRLQRSIDEQLGGANPLLPLEVAHIHAIRVARAMTEQTGGEFHGQARAERERDVELEPAGELHPARFAHEIIDCYLEAAGDFVHGTGLTTEPQHNLAFSPGTLARSACEYANRCWWLADPAIDVRKRIARALSVWRDTTGQERSVLNPDLVAKLDELSSRLTAWAASCDPALPRAKLPKPTNLFQDIYGQEGAWDYSWLGNNAHGSFLTVLLRRHAIANRSEEHYVDAWRRVLIATRNGINAATRVHDLRGRDSLLLREVYDEHDQLSGAFEAWIDEQQEDDG